MKRPISLAHLSAVDLPPPALIEAAARAGLEALLGRWGARIEAAGSLEEAERLAGKGPAPDLVLLDFHFGDSLTGPDAFEALQTYWSQVPPAILITADRSPQVEDMAKARGFGLLHKPVEAASLRALMTGFLRRAAE